MGNRNINNHPRSRGNRTGTEEDPRRQTHEFEMREKHQRQENKKKLEIMKIKSYGGEEEMKTEVRFIDF